MAVRAGAGHSGAVPALNSYSYLFGPVAAFGLLGVIVLLLRWTFSRGHSLVERRAVPGPESSYGLLVAIASPGSYVEGELLRHRLTDAGLRATLAQTSDGPRLMVFRRDEAAARRLLAAR